MKLALDRAATPDEIAAITAALEMLFAPESPVAQTRPSRWRSPDSAFSEDFETLRWARRERHGLLR